MNTHELRNMGKAIGILFVETLIVLLGLWSLAYTTGAGSENFYIGVIFVLLQALGIILSYTLWYLSANRQAADLINMEEMRRAAFRRIPKYLLLSLLITGVIAAVGVAAVLFRFIFVEIEQVYSLSAVLMELVVGNFTLLLMMCFWGLPDRVLGRY